MQAQRIEASRARLASRAITTARRLLPRACGAARNGADARPGQGGRAHQARLPRRRASVHRSRRGGRAGGLRGTLCQQVVDRVKTRAGARRSSRCEWVPVTIDNRLREVQQGNIDLLCTPTSVTLARRQEVSFSIPVFAGRHPRGAARGRAAGAARRALRQREPASRVARLPGGQVIEKTKFAVVTGTTTATLARGPAQLPAGRRHRRAGSRLSHRAAEAAWPARSTCSSASAPLVLGAMDDAARKNLVVLDRLFTHESGALALAQGRRRFPRCSSIARSATSTRAASFRELYAQWFGEFDENARTFFRVEHALPRTNRWTLRSNVEMIQRSMQAAAACGRSSWTTSSARPTAEGRAVRGARAGAAGPRDRGRRGDLRGGRHVRDRVGLRDPRRADRLDARRRQGRTHGSRAFIEFVRSRNDKIPIFLMAERGEASAIPVDVMEMVDEFIWTLEDTAAFVGGRVVAAIRRYLEVMLPPLAAALMKFTQEYEYSWHTPGHTGGTAFLKSPVGRIFFDYFGENLLRSDLSISVGEPRLAARPHRARSASTRSTRRACSARTAPTASPTARRCRTA